MLQAHQPNARILVVEDNVTTSNTIGLFLSAEGYAVDTAFTGKEGMAKFAATGADLILLDLMLPDTDGIEFCRSIRKTSKTPIVILTAKTAEDDIVTGLESGADDYVCKPFASRELLARIRLCIRRSSENGDLGARLRSGDLEIDVDRRLVRVSGEPVKLTKSEFNILHVLMQSPGRVFTREQLIASALGPDFDGYDRTVDTHIWSLRKKIGRGQGKQDYIQSEMGIGYRFNAEIS